jgi:hypothetical protein
MWVFGLEEYLGRRKNPSSKNRTTYSSMNANFPFLSKLKTALLYIVLLDCETVTFSKGKLE